MKAVQVQDRKVRYAVVGVGWISQAQFLPGVEHTGNSEVVALVTGHAEKAAKVGEKYGIGEEVYLYEEFDQLLTSGKIDAVYLATPNDDHVDLAVQTLNVGVHLLLEKPMSTSVAECERILAAQEGSGAKLMIAYRLHHEPGTLRAIERVRKGDLGRIVAFNSSFSQHVHGQNHRARHGYWGGPVPDMGVYCINAARNLFTAEPEEVVAAGVQTDERFNFQDTVSVTMKFPGPRIASVAPRIASFVVTYNGGDVDDYRIIGEKGDLFSQPAYQVGSRIEHVVTIGTRKTSETFSATDHFGGELKYFSNCILNNHEPEADGEEGLLDVRVLEAVEQSLQTGKPVKLLPYDRKRRPAEQQVEKLSPHGKVELIDAHQPSKGQ
ncbi:MAG: Gfo/Idh/MocA family oxidoreductase [Acidobacteria bacterium]|nr:Gfo/Idh/MocA family oxidoreductase [Acidobacteriota bacterium]